MTGPYGSEPHTAITAVWRCLRDRREAARVLRDTPGRATVGRGGFRTLRGARLLEMARHALRVDPLGPARLFVPPTGAAPHAGAAVEADAEADAGADTGAFGGRGARLLARVAPLLGLLLAALLLTPRVVHAAGYVIIGPIIPTEPPVHVPPQPRPIPRHRERRGDQPIRLAQHHVSVAIQGRVAVTSVEQVFHNPNGRQLEGTYVFPLADDAAIDGFSLWMGGEEVRGELLEKEKARGIYESIVRKMRDPALLEYVGKRAFRARLFPIPASGEMRIKLTYTQALPAEAGLVGYTYPLRHRMAPATAARPGASDDPTPPITIQTRMDGASSTTRRPILAPPTTSGPGTDATAKRFSLLVDLQDPNRILNLYSPTHQVEVVRKGPKHLKLSLEARNVGAARDFKLFYNVSDKEVGLSLIPYRPRGEEGYFMAILAPRDEMDTTKLPPKDVVFVLDTSRSMVDGDKIGQAKAALRYCLASLNEQDHVGVVRFATEAEDLTDGLQPASKATVETALKKVAEIRATGGTAIDEALRMALAMNKHPDRPFVVVFLTDGEPTIGERDPRMILNNMKVARKENVRLFSFGVGFDVNADLLDALSRAGKGSSTYVAPEETIEVKVSAFYTRLSSPVLTDATLEFVDLETYAVSPKVVGDVFRDQQVMVTGRYKGAGPHAIRLRGTLMGKEKVYTYEATFPEREESNDFLPKIWAMRRVGYLLEQVQAHGESEELRQEIVTLSKRYGIMTPYTSWLVIEDHRRGDQPITTPQADPSRGAPDAEVARAKRGAMKIGGKFSTVHSWSEAAEALEAEDAGLAAAARVQGRYAATSDASASAADTAAAPVPAAESREAEFAFRRSARQLQESAADGLAFGARDGADQRLEKAADRLGGPATMGIGRPSTDAPAEAKALEAGRQAAYSGVAPAPAQRPAGEPAYAAPIRTADGEPGAVEASARGPILRTVGVRTFYYQGERWVDAEFRKGVKARRVVYLSEEYFQLLEKHPEAAKWLALGTRVVVKIGDEFVEVVPPDEAIETSSVDKSGDTARSRTEPAETAMAPRRMR